MQFVVIVSVQHKQVYS